MVAADCGAGTERVAPANGETPTAADEPEAGSSAETAPVQGAAQSIQIVRRQCAFAATTQGEGLPTFRSLVTVPLGRTPRTVQLPDQDREGETNVNPAPDQADQFLRAASGVVFVDHALAEAAQQPARVAVFQDSRRRIGLADLGRSLGELLKAVEKARTPEQGLRSSLKNLSARISVLPAAPPAIIARDDNDEEDYQSVRKTKKRDFEAATILPSGEVLVLGSGSDLHEADEAEGESYRALIFDSATGRVARYDLTGFYRTLLAQPQLVGTAHEGQEPGLNIEGVTVRPVEGGFALSLFHRGNVNGNGHNAIIEYELNPWLARLTTAPVGEASLEPDWAALRPRRVIQLVTPAIVTDGDPSNRPVPLTINHGLYGELEGRPTFVIPVGAEAEFVDSQGIHHDGRVTFAGLLVVRDVDGPEGRCEIFQAPGDPPPGQTSRYGKLEGLAAFNSQGATPFARSLFTRTSLVVGVNDRDAEYVPSELSLLDLTGF
jgi:hypothetical protein